MSVSKSSLNTKTDLLYNQHNFLNQCIYYQSTTLISLILMVKDVHKPCKQSHRKINTLLDMNKASNRCQLDRTQKTLGSSVLKGPRFQ